MSTNCMLYSRTHKAGQQSKRIAKYDIADLAALQLLVQDVCEIYKGNLAEHAHERPNFDGPAWNRHQHLVNERRHEEHHETGEFFAHSIVEARKVDMPDQPIVHWQIPQPPVIF